MLLVNHMKIKCKRKDTSIERCVNHYFYICKSVLEKLKEKKETKIKKGETKKRLCTKMIIMGEKTCKKKKGTRVLSCIIWNARHDMLPANFLLPLACINAGCS